MTSPTLNRSQYLPEFLLGDVSQLADGNSEEGAMTSPLATSSCSTDASFMAQSTSTMQQLSPNNVLLSSSLRPDYNRGTKPRINGPPIVSLFDQTVTQNGLSTSSSPSHQMGTSNNISDNQSSEGYWIVVFGFPPSHSAHILSIFNQLGNVVEHSIPTVGNWMLLKYSCRTEVRKALTYDKRIVNGNIMIAVTEKKNLNQMRPIETYGTPSSPCYNNVRSPVSPMTSPSIRHMSVARRLENGPAVPQRDTSIVTKVFDLLFGW